MISSRTSFLLGLIVILCFIASPVAAFGAGDIIDVSKINNINWRHGDIESILVEIAIKAGSSTKFDKLDIKKVYFGNWLRDYSQAIDVGGLKQLPADTIRVLLWCLSFITFGYATGEFEVTADRLGCYRPEEHIDNPKDYADNEDARQYDPRLRGPVDEGKELAIDPDTGLKVYIASENRGIETSAGLVRRLFEHAIELGRNHHKNNSDKVAFNEALRLLGTGLHCLEDFSAHSNYTELALKELGVDAFPHVGRATELDVKGKKVFPVVTGTFGMTDFLHSVAGEVGDKVAQSEIEEMESKLDKASEEDAKNDQTSILKSILDKVPWEMLADKDKPDPAKADALREAANKKAEETKNNPPDSNASLGGVNIEEAKRISEQTLKDMYPILEFHDQVMKGIAKVTSKVPGLDELTENISGALQIFIFSLLAPYVKPIIAHARVELKSSSEGILKTSLKGQYEVFENDQSSNPTHSMLSKDHFSNVLNPVAGQVAVSTVKFVVPLIVEAWADDSKDVRQVIDEILQVFHHPALRDENRPGQKAMFETVKKWWEDKSEEDKNHLKEILTFDGVKNGKNHEGESAGGHSHGPPKKNDSEVPSAQEGATAIAGITGGLTNFVLEKTGLDKTFGKVNTQSKHSAAETSHGGSSSYGRKDDEDTQQTTSSGYGRQDTEQTSTYQSSSGYGRQDSKQTSSYGRRHDNDNENSTYGSSGHGRRTDNEESSYGSGNKYGSSGRNDNETSSYGGNTYGSSGRDDNETSSYGGSNTYGSSRRDDNETSSYGGSNTYGSSRRDDNETPSYGGRHSSSRRDDDQETSTYGGSNTYGSSRRNDDNETSSYGGGNTFSTSHRDDNEETSSYGRNTHGSSRHNDDNEESSYSSRRNDDEDNSYSGGNTYGSSRRNNDDDDNQESSYGQRRQGRNEESEGYGGSSRY